MRNLYPLSFECTAPCYLLFVCLSLPLCLPGQIFNDQFERSQLGSFWDGDGGWTIRNGQAYNGIDDDWTLLTTTQSFDATSYVLETEVSNLVDGYFRAYYLLFGQQGDSGEPGYVFRYDPLGAGVVTLGLATDNYLYPDVLDDQIIRLDPQAAHKIRIEKYESGLIQVYIGSDDGFPDTPNLEAIDNTYPSLSKVSWTTFTQSIGEEFFVEYIRADVPETQKTETEKPVEDELIKQVVVDSEAEYEIGQLTEGARFYTDRPYTITSVPDFLDGATFIKTANDDKLRTEDAFLTAFIKEQAIAYVGYDPRASELPDWLSDWTKTDVTIGTTDPGSDFFEVYTKVIPFAVFAPTAFVLDLGGALAAPARGSNMNYIVAVVPASGTRYEAEEAFLSGAKVATNHTGFEGTGFADYTNPTGDYIEWTVDLPATAPYSISTRFANGSDAARDMELSVDGEVVATPSFGAFPGWSRWVFTLVKNSILLDAGEHTIRLTATGDSGPNIDYLQVSPTIVSPSSAVAYTASPSPPAVVASTTVLAYPNPAIDEVTLEVAALGAADLQVFDVQGRQVYAQSLADESGETRQRIDVTSWPAGTYVYRLVAGEEVATGKFVKR